MSTLQFTPEEQANFTQAVRYGRNYIVTLNSYQKDRLGDLAREKQYRAIQVNTERFERQPYDSQEPGQLDYWLNSAPAYVESQQVLGLLAEPATVATSTAIPEAKEAPKLSLRQVALLYIYSEKNEGIKHGAHANDIANQYINPQTGQRHKSGQRLYSLYNDLQDTRNRINVIGKEIKPLIKDIEAVLPYLDGRFKQNAESELSTLMNRI